MRSRRTARENGYKRAPEVYDFTGTIESPDMPRREFMVCCDGRVNCCRDAMSKKHYTDMLELDPHALVGKGLHRECYLHPDDPSRCIKIVVAGKRNENHREQAYYAALARRGVTWEMLPKFHGLVPTNLGEGAVFDLVRDYDNRISLTLGHYLGSEQLTSLHAAALRRALQDLKSYLLEQRIITMTLKPKNILFQRQTAETGKLVIVDNIGNSDFLPLANYSTRLAQWKIRRKWHRFERSMRRDFAGNKALGQVLAPGPGQG